MAKRKHHTTAYRKAADALEAEGRKQCVLLYSATALALRRHWNKKRLATSRLFEVSLIAWNRCAKDNLHSMIQMCEEETGIEIQNGEGKSWHDLIYMNAELDANRLTNAQWVRMRQQQVKWVAPQIMACMLVALHRKWGFGFERCGRVYQQVQDIEAEFKYDPKRILIACEQETGINVLDVVTYSREEEANGFD